MTQTQHPGHPRESLNQIMHLVPNQAVLPVNLLCYLHNKNICPPNIRPKSSHLQRVSVAQKAARSFHSTTNTIIFKKKKKKSHTIVSCQLVSMKSSQIVSSKRQKWTDKWLNQNKAKSHWRRRQREKAKRLFIRKGKRNLFQVWLKKHTVSKSLKVRKSMLLQRLSSTRKGELSS